MYKKKHELIFICRLLTSGLNIISDNWADGTSMYFTFILLFCNSNAETMSIKNKKIIFYPILLIHDSIKYNIMYIPTL